MTHPYVIEQLVAHHRADLEVDVARTHRIREARAPARPTRAVTGPRWRLHLHRHGPVVPTPV